MEWAMDDQLEPLGLTMDDLRMKPEGVAFPPGRRSMKNMRPFSTVSARAWGRAVFTRRQGAALQHYP